MIYSTDLIIDFNNWYYQYRMSLKVAVFCNNNFYGQECTTYCVTAHSCSVSSLGYSTKVYQVYQIVIIIIYLRSLIYYFNNF